MLYRLSYLPVPEGTAGLRARSVIGESYQRTAATGKTVPPTSRATLRSLDMSGNWGRDPVARRGLMTTGSPPQRPEGPRVAAITRLDARPAYSVAGTDAASRPHVPDPHRTPSLRIVTRRVRSSRSVGGLDHTSLLARRRQAQQAREYPLRTKGFPSANRGLTLAWQRRPPELPGLGDMTEAPRGRPAR